MSLDQVGALLAKGGRYAVAATCFFIPISTSLMGLFAALIIPFWLGSGQLKNLGRLCRSSLFCLVSLVLFSLFILGIAYSPAELGEALDALKKYRELLYIPVVMSLMWGRKGESATAVHAFFAGCIVVQFISYAMALGIVPSERYGYSLTYHITHSFFMAILVFWTAHKVFDAKGKNPFWIILLLLTVGNIIYIAPGRTGMLVFLLLMLLFLWQRLSWRNLLVGLVLLSCAVTLFNYSSRNFSGRFLEAFQEITTYTPGTSRTSLGMRFDWWFDSIQLIQEKPLLGHGTGSFTLKHDQLIRETQINPTDNPHNEYLFIAVQLGGLGLMLFVGLFAAGWFGSFALNNEQKWLVQGVLLSMAAGCLMNSFLFDSHQGHYFAFLSALLLSSCSGSSNTWFGKGGHCSAT